MVQQWMTAACVAAAVLGAPAGAIAAGLAVSIGIRETGTDSPIGGDGGAAGAGIEWVNRDAQMLELDGTWQTFTFRFQSDPLTPFAGVTADGLYDGASGVLEHIRLLNVDGITAPIRIYIDDIVNAIAGAPSAVVSGFEPDDPFPATLGTEHIFQEPGLSGSTQGNLAPLPDSASVTDAEAASGTQSYAVEFGFVDDDPTRWLRLTSFEADNQPNPAIFFGNGATLTLALKGVIVPEPSSAALLALGAAGLGAVRRRPRRP